MPKKSKNVKDLIPQEEDLVIDDQTNEQEQERGLEEYVMPDSLSSVEDVLRDSEAEVAYKISIMAKRGNPTGIKAYLDLRDQTFNPTKVRIDIPPFKIPTPTPEEATKIMIEHIRAHFYAIDDMAIPALWIDKDEVMRVYDPDYTKDEMYSGQYWEKNKHGFFDIDNLGLSATVREGTTFREFCTDPRVVKMAFLLHYVKEFLLQVSNAKSALFNSILSGKIKNNETFELLLMRAEKCFISHWNEFLDRCLLIEVRIGNKQMADLIREGKKAHPELDPKIDNNSEEWHKARANKQRELDKIYDGMVFHSLKLFDEFDKELRVPFLMRETGTLKYQQF